MSEQPTRPPVAVPAVAIATPELAGRCMPAFMFACGGCRIMVPLYHPRGFEVTKLQATKIAREHGWSKTNTLGWVCPACKGGKR